MARDAHGNLMTRSRVLTFALMALTLAALLAGGTPAYAQEADTPYEPTPGMPGKDAVWVPTSPALVETMLDLAGVTAKDYVIDLGSGDGRMVIAAAKRGARALGVEFNRDLVEHSQRLAQESGVSDRASFVEGDMFTADISKATVLALFLLSEHLRQLTPNFLALRPGTRIVVNTFGIPDWEVARVETLEKDCTSWCEARLYLVPAPVAGTWKLPDGSLQLQQSVNRVTGTVTSGDRTLEIDEGVVQGTALTFSAGGEHYAGRVKGSRIDGTVTSGGSERTLSARRQN